MTSQMVGQAVQSRTSSRWEDPAFVREYNKAYRQAHLTEAKERARLYHQNNRERENVRKRTWRQQNKERLNAHLRSLPRKERKAWRQQYYQENKERLTADRKRLQAAPLANAKTRLLGAKYQAKKHGYVAIILTAEEIVEKLRVKDCEICGKPIQGRQQHLDHDHQTGKFRGVLCARCNLLVGTLESPLKETALNYLKNRS